MLARSGTPHGTVVSAKSQSAGRGRHGRQWVSPEGNLYASLIVRFDLPLARARELGFLAALSVADVAQAYLPATKRVRVKWPNDVLVDGQKLAGILVEGERCQKRAWWAVVGIGVNVLEAPFGLPYPATSLRKEGAGEAGAPRSFRDCSTRSVRGLTAGQRRGLRRYGAGGSKGRMSSAGLSGSASESEQSWERRSISTPRAP